jgi:DNA-binding response OmpR family regulator
MARKVLLVEDAEEYQLIVSRALANADIDLSIATSLAEAHQIAKDFGSQIDLAILDLVLPDGDGLAVLEDLRIYGFNSPVFFLSSEAKLDAKLTAFNLGADDYIVKPINPLELRARVEMRLKKKNSRLPETIVRGELTIEPMLLRGSRLVNNRPADLQLTAKEFKILTFLLQNEGQVFSRSQVVEAVWGSGVHVLDRTVDSHIHGLRKKMGPISPYIECIPSAGYRFSTPKLKAAVG